MSSLIRKARGAPFYYYAETLKRFGDDEDLLKAAGFFDDGLPDGYLLDAVMAGNFRPTPFGKVRRACQALALNEVPVVMLCSGSFAPVHAGHIDALLAARDAIDGSVDDDGAVRRVVGGYLSPSHDSYVWTKPGAEMLVGEQRVSMARSMIAADERLRDWVEVDPWEALYVSSAINFTDVVFNLKYTLLGLGLVLRRQVEVAFVYGADNASFAYAFGDDDLNVCVGRRGQNYGERMESVRRNPLLAKGTVFAEAHAVTGDVSSTAIRAAGLPQVRPLHGEVTLRNEGLSHYLGWSFMFGMKELARRLDTFSTTLRDVMALAYGGRVKVREITPDMLEAELLRQRVGHVPTVSLDMAIPADHALAVSRLFDVCSTQDHPIRLVARPGHPDLATQMSAITARRVVLVDDDTASGFTRREATRLLAENGVEVVKGIDLMPAVANKLDVLDMRDFLVGAPDGGLVVELPSGKHGRAPYLLPWVNLETRARMPPGNHLNFSRAVWHANAVFFAGSGMTLGQLGGMACHESPFSQLVRELCGKEVSSSTEVEHLCLRVVAEMFGEPAS